MGDDIQKIKELIESAERSIREVKRMYQNIAGGSASVMPNISVGEDGDSENVVEGRFDGQSMIDDMGKMYPVSANYASKSKLVEGDRLKLSIMGNGSFIFKQIGPIERNRVIATIKEDGTGRGFIAEAEDKTYKILFASVTYFKVRSGDKVVLLVPRDNPSVWGAIENVLEVNLSDNAVIEKVMEEHENIINPEKSAFADNRVPDSMASDEVPVVKQGKIEDKIGDFEW